MSKFTYNPNNTEGKYPTALEVRDMELRKDDKAVATDLVDLYDVEITDPQDKEIIVYDSQKSKWVNGEPGGSCDTITTTTTITVGDGGDYPDLKTCFEALRANCKKISEEAYLYIVLVSDLRIRERASLNHPYGHRIIIDGKNNYTITTYRGIIYFLQYTNTTIGTKKIAGDMHTLMIASDDTLWGAGRNDYRELGIPPDPGKDTVSVHTLLIADEKWKSVAVTNYGSLAIKMDGTLWVCGYQSNGELGLGSINSVTEWTQIGNDNNWMSVSAIFNKSYAIKTDGTLWQTGVCTNGTFNTWTQLGTDTDWKKVYAQESFTIIMKTNDKIWLCGRHFITHENYPDPVLFDNNVWDKIAVGDQFIIGLVNSLLFGIGLNDDGQLGLGTDSFFDTWTLTGNGTADWVDVKAGSVQSIALKNDNSLWACGHYAYNGLDGPGNAIYFIEEPNHYRNWNAIFYYRLGVGGNRPIGYDIISEYDYYYRAGSNFSHQLGIPTGIGIATELTYYVHLIIDVFVDEDQVEEAENNRIISVSDNHTITIQNTRFESIDSLNRVYYTLETNAKSIYTSAFAVENNSNVIFENCTFYDEKWEVYEVINGGTPNPSRYLRVKNNSTALMTTQYNVLVDNASSVVLKNPYNSTTEFTVTAKNNSKIIISSDDMQYMTPELENSEIIEFLEV
jgi:hypothetical protein